MPVSYTHLDVYKRQELDCIFLSLDLQPETGKTKTEQISALRRHIQLLRRYDGGRLR